MSTDISTGFLFSHLHESGGTRAENSSSKKELPPQTTLYSPYTKILESFYHLEQMENNSEQTNELSTSSTSHDFLIVHERTNQGDEEEETSLVNNLSHYSYLSDTTREIPSNLSPQKLEHVSFQDIIREVEENTKLIEKISPRHSDRVLMATSQSSIDVPHSTINSPSILTQYFQSPIRTTETTPRTQSIREEIQSLQLSEEVERRSILHNTLSYDCSPRFISPQQTSRKTPNVDHCSMTNTPRHIPSRSPSPMASINMNSMTTPPSTNRSFTSSSTRRSSSPNRVPVKKTPIAYSDVRHLNAHRNRGDGYNHSTIDWYLNLCSDKYERSASPTKRVKWVGLKKNFIRNE